jgi:Cysteine-rich secretory protein family
MKIKMLVLLSLCVIAFRDLPLYAEATEMPLIYADSVLAFTNAERYKEGAPLLASNTLLSNVARKKMTDLFARQYFAHESPTGESVSDLAKREGYEYIVVGENLALGDFASSKAVVEAWMDSPGHRKNILSKSYSEIGIAAGRSNYEGRNTWIVVQSFGFPKSSCPVINTDLEKEINIVEQKLSILKTIANLREKEVEKSKGSLEVRIKLVETYNTAARLYNTTLDGYRDLIEEYNEEVGEYNNCLKEVKESL